MPALTRRSFIVCGAVLSAAAGIPRLAHATPRPAAGGPPAARPLPADPFTLGVASGDPAHDGFVIWTRLAPQPLAEDGLGGMPARNVPVHWEVAADERFRTVVRRGVA